jgi:formylglycine-generating enzyme required for sulfatase activity
MTKDRTPKTSPKSGVVSWCRGWLHLKCLAAMTLVLWLLPMGVLGQMVLDDFSVKNKSKYNFIPVSNGATDDWAVTSGQMRPNIAINTIGAWVWNQGHKLSAVGDSVSITLYPAWNHSELSTGIGLLFTATATSASGHRSVGVANSGVGINAFCVGDEQLTRCTYPGGTGPLLLTVQMTAQTPNSSSYRATLSGAGFFDPSGRATLEFSANANSLFFGPFAGNTANSGAAFDDLTFSGRAANAVAPELVWVVPGTFTMGSPESEVGHSPFESPQTVVTLTRGFFVGKHEVTQEEYAAVIGSNPSVFQGDLRQPVQNVTWSDATNYCQRLTQQQSGSLPAGWAYRLPTEAEWEYACRAGTSSRFSFGDDPTLALIASYVWYVSISGLAPHLVGTKLPNPWGLYDMNGNVSEWCSDRGSARLPGGNVADPQGPDSGAGHVFRGGSFFDGPGLCRSATRGYDIDGNLKDGLHGFRVVLIPTPDFDGSQNPGNVVTPNKPTYGDCPDKLLGMDSLIVVTHGWNPDLRWLEEMTNAISGYLAGRGLNNWQVHAHKWVGKATVPAIALGFERALYRGVDEGGNLGNCLATQNWSRIHFIAHSAGAGLIQASTLAIKDPSNGSLGTIIHETFLDPFSGITYGGKGKYGKGADWSDSYFTRDPETILTDKLLENAYNIDITFLDLIHRQEVAVTYSTPSGEISQTCYQTVSSHEWPHQFYTQTIPPNSVFGSEGFGFPVSKDAGRWDDLPTLYKVGEMHPPLGSGGLSCIADNELTVSAIPKKVEFTNADIIRSSTGSVIIHGIDFFSLRTGSPVWMAVVVPSTNTFNVLSFEAGFSSTTVAEGLLSVYWGTNLLGSVNERTVLPGVRQYSFPLTETVTGTHLLGFRLDRFSPATSSVLVTNVSLGFVGVPSPFSLSFTGTYTNALPVIQLNGPAGYNYSVEASTNLIDWKIITILVNTNATVRFVDRESTNSTARFYRAVGP